MVEIRVSQAGACPRRLQLEAWGIQGLPLTDYTLRAFEEGRIHEASILDWAAQNLPGGPYTVDYQQIELWSPEDSYILRGHIDGLAMNGDTVYLLEAKCLSSKAFQELRGKGAQQSHPQYYTQVQLYLHLLRPYSHLWGMHINTAYLVARNKETPRNRFWDHYYERIPYDPEFARQELSRLCELAHAIEEKREAPKPYNPEKDWQCRRAWCQYSTLCWPEWNKPKAEAVTDDSIADVVEQYQSLGEEISELEKAREELKTRLLASLNGKPVVAGRWMLHKVERRQERFDTSAARRELPADVLARLIKVNTFEQLKIEEAN